MLVKFVLRAPGDHHQIAESTMEAIPREGEWVTIGDKTRLVHDVIWNVTEGSVMVLLRE